jgi:tRNA-2-methylthio-N6-dimethylallyladenosine synthase
MCYNKKTHELEQGALPLSEQLLIPLEEERKYIAQLRQIMQVRKRGEVPLAFVHTYGCQQNVADSEKIKGMLARMGFSFTQQPADADFILFNTCAVREHAEDRVFGNVGALKNIKRRHPSVIIALCGCMMEQEHVAKRIHDSYPFVNMLFGTHQICRFPKLLFTCITDSRRVFVRGGEEQDHTIAEGLPTYRDGKVKAWLTIMYGCNNFCSYCIVPYVRGRERSRTPQAVLAEFQQLVAQGYKDITLLGQNVNSYGKKQQLRR